MKETSALPLKIVKEEEIAGKSYHLTLPLPPSTNHVYVPIQGRNTRALTSLAKQYKHIAGKEAIAQGIRMPLQGAVGVILRFYGLASNADIANREKVLIDAFKGIAWEDDKQIRFLFMMREEKDEKGSRVEVDIYDATYGPICPAWGKLCQRVISPERS